MKKKYVTDTSEQKVDLPAVNFNIGPRLIGAFINGRSFWWGNWGDITRFQWSHGPLLITGGGPLCFRGESMVRQDEFHVGRWKFSKKTLHLLGPVSAFAKCTLPYCPS